MAALALGLAMAVPVAAQIRLDDSDQASAARARYDAIRALREGRYDDVLALLGAVPSDPDVLLARGRVLAITGKYDQAQSAFEAAAARRPASEAALELGRLHLTLGRTTDGRRALEPVIAAGLHSDLGEVHRPRGARRAAARTVRAGEQPVSRRGRPDWRRRRSADRVGTALPRKAEQARSGPIVPRGADRRPPQSSRARRTRACIRRRERRRPRATWLNAPSAVNPSFVPAHLVLAELALDEDHQADARAALEKALAVNPSNLEALSLQAAMAFLDDRTADFDALVREGAGDQPAIRRGVPASPAPQAARHYRFDAAVELTRKALALDPGNVRASAELGVHLLRTGDEPSARASLDRGLQADPYDVVSYNLLGLLDSLDSFRDAAGWRSSRCGCIQTKHRC